MEKREQDNKEIESKNDDFNFKTQHSNNQGKPFIQHLISKFPSLYIILKDKSVKNALVNIKGYKSIKKNNLVDIDYYLKNNNNVRLSGMDPILHYMYHGFKEGKKPNPSFDGNYYLKKYKNVKKSNLNPLVHYCLYGIYEGRKTQKSQEVLKNKLDIEKAKLKHTTDKLKILEEERNELATMPTYKGLRRSLKGKDGYLFLINDSNHEMRQHFDSLYNNNFNTRLFIKNLNYKKKFCGNNDIGYFFFVIPDKSLVCRDFLPFDVKLIKRNCDLISYVVPDFIKNLDHNCYFKVNSHINYFGGKELAYNYLNYINNKFNRDNFDELVKNQIAVVNDLHISDLKMPQNWSYSEEEKEEYPDEEAVFFRNKFLINLRENLPEKFKIVSIRETEYYENPKGLTDLKVLILRDSSLNYLKGMLSMYFKEILLYWDHWFFNEELIKWYNPDIILEIRTERFLENMKYEIV